MSVLAVIEHDRGTIASASLGVLTAARNLATQMGTSLEAVTVGANADSLATVAAQYGATVVHQAHHAALTDFGPEAWGEAIAQVVGATSPQVVMGTGTERGHEVIAQVAARLDLPASMNCIEFDSAFTGTQPLKVVRARWGGSLLEQSEVDAAIKLVTLANHTVEAVESSANATNTVHNVELNDSVMHSFVQDRVERVAGEGAYLVRGQAHRQARPVPVDRTVLRLGRGAARAAGHPGRCHRHEGRREEARRIHALPVARPALAAGVDHRHARPEGARAGNAEGGFLPAHPRQR